MGTDTPSSVAPGCGAMDILLIVFIVLKCIHVIDWPWPIVLIPLWISLAIGAIVALLVLAAISSKEL